MKEDLINRDNLFRRESTQDVNLGRFFVIGCLLIISIVACEPRKELLSQEVYEGPAMEMQDVNTMMTDSGKQAMKLKAPLQLDYDNGDKEYPEGLYLEYFGKDPTPICIFESNSAVFDQETNLWRGEGNVRVKNLRNGDALTTEVLFWSPADEKFYTDKFVTIISEGEIHKGQGLTANQDFSSYQIMKPSGTINLNEEF